MVAWRSGANYNQMAEQFELTPSAVAGIIGRNKVLGETVVQPLQTSDISRVERLSARTKWLTVSVRGMRFDVCQWIAGEPSYDDVVKCGTVTGTGRVYCLEHEIRSVQPPELRRGRRRNVYKTG